MTLWSNYRAALDAAMTLLFHAEGYWRDTSEFHCRPQRKVQSTLTLQRKRIYG